MAFVELPQLDAKQESNFVLAVQELQNTGEIETLEAADLLELVDLGYLDCRDLLVREDASPPLEGALAQALEQLGHALAAKAPWPIDWRMVRWFLAHGYVRCVRFELTSAGRRALAGLDLR